MKIVVFCVCIGVALVIAGIILLASSIKNNGYQANVVSFDGAILRYRNYSTLIYNQSDCFQTYYKLDYHFAYTYNQQQYENNACSINSLIYVCSNVFTICENPSYGTQCCPIVTTTLSDYNKTSNISTIWINQDKPSVIYLSDPRSDNFNTAGILFLMLLCFSLIFFCVIGCCEYQRRSKIEEEELLIQT